MAFPLLPARIAEIIGCRNVQSVALNWPVVEQCLADYPGYSDRVAIAALATIAVETAYTFRPIHEYGSRDYFIAHYWANERVRTMLGNRSAEDAWKYAGRGFIQLTGRHNYQEASQALGIDLVDDPEDPSDDLDPEKACQPAIAASLLADFFVKHHVYDAANAGNWTKVRRIVNGGTNGLQAFLALCGRLEAAINGNQS